MQALNCASIRESSISCQKEDLVPRGPEDHADFFPSSEESAVGSSDRDDPAFGSESSSNVEEVFQTSSEEGQAASSRPAKRARYAKRRSASEPLTFLGSTVCRRAYARLLQVGGSTVSRLRSGETAFTNKMRPPVAKHPIFHFSLRGDCEARWKDILMFLWQIYHSAAEVLPTNWKTVAGNEAPFPDDPADPEDDRERLIQSIAQTINTRTTDLEVNMIGPGTFQGPRRSLMHGSRTELYWEYRVFCETNKVQSASYTTFMKVTNKVLKPGQRGNHLRFRKKTEHGQCDVCYRLRQKVQKAKGDGDKMEFQKDLHRHYLSQWLDRQQYWSCRTMSQQWFSNVISQNERLSQPSNVAWSLACIIEDGMDQCKFKVPRLKGGARQSKLFQRLFRPTLHLSACWLHGYQMYLYVTDQDVKKDSCAQVEQLVRTLSDTWTTIGDLPHGISWHQDNTYREGKNQFTMAFGCLMVALGVMRHFTASYLRTGHSPSAVCGAQSGKFLMKFRKPFHC